MCMCSVHLRLHEALPFAFAALGRLQKSSLLLCTVLFARLRFW
jgi:hypothetical protein